MTRSSRNSEYQDLEEIRVRFEEFRSGNRPRTRFPEELWRAAAEIAARRGMKITARVLHLDTNSLKTWMDKQADQAQRPAEPKRAKRKYRKRKAAVVETPATFLELLAPSPASAASCIVGFLAALPHPLPCSHRRRRLAPDRFGIRRRWNHALPEPHQQGNQLECVLWRGLACVSRADHF